jgi:polysaccharide chain length determinant protein (PEP-CTERM system associated)
MDQLIRQALLIGRGIWQRRVPGLVAAWIAGVIGAIVVLQLPDQYEASARVYVDTDSVLQPLMRGLAIQPNVSQRVSILSRTLISRPNVEKLIRMTDLDHTLTTPGEKERLVDELMGKLQIQAAGVGNLYSINFRDPSPEQAQKIVQSLLSIFMESSLGNKRQDSTQAKEFIEEQIAQYEARLREAENRVKEFRLRNLGLLSSSGDYFGRMEALGNEIEKARRELREAEMSRDSLRTQIQQQEETAKTAAEVGPSAPPVDVPVPEIDSRLQVLRENLDELLRKYTDQHPDVIWTKRVIGDLEEARKREVEARLKAQAGSIGGGTPATTIQGMVLQQLKIGLGEAEAQVAALRGRVADYETRYKQLKDSAESVPQVDTELAQLNRDYDIVKSQYANLVARRESASMTGELEESGNVTDFRIIDPPRVGNKPAAPNRLLLISLTFVAALGVGAAISFLVSQMLPTFWDVRTLREITKRSVLGSVSALERPALIKAQRRKNWVFFGALGGLAGCYAMLALAIHLLPTK